VSLGVADATGVSDGVALGLAVLLAVGVTVAVGDAVGVLEGSTLAVAVAVGLADGTTPSTPSTTPVAPVPTENRSDGLMDCPSTWENAPVRPSESRMANVAPGAGMKPLIRRISNVPFSAAAPPTNSRSNCEPGVVPPISVISWPAPLWL
jgi:hypothetical protein